MRSRQYRFGEGGVGARNGRIEGKPAHDHDYPCTRDETMGAGADSGHVATRIWRRFCPSRRCRAEKSRSRRQKWFRKTRRFAPGDASTRGRFANRPDACRTKEKLASVSKEWVGCSPVCLGEGGCVCGKVSRLAARKPCFRGRRADQERFSASGQATVRDPYGTQLEKIRFPRFGFGSRETLDEGSISHVRSPCQKFQRPRLFCNSRPQAARGPVPRAEPTGARREEGGARPIRARRTNRGERGARLEVIARDRRPRPVSAPSRRIGGTARRRQRTTGGHGSRGLQVLQGPVQHRGGEEAAGGPGDWAGSTRGNRRRRTRR